MPYTTKQLCEHFNCERLGGSCRIWVDGSHGPGMVAWPGR